MTITKLHVQPLQRARTARDPRFTHGPAQRGEWRASAHRRWVVQWQSPSCYSLVNVYTTMESFAIFLMGKLWTSPFLMGKKTFTELWKITFFLWVNYGNHLFSWVRAT